MTWKTHATFGVLMTSVGLSALGIPLSIELLGVGALGSLAPDLDAHESKIKHLKITWGRGRKRVVIKPFLPLAAVVSLLFRHRGPLHSLLAIFILTLLAVVLHLNFGGNTIFTISFLIGFLSHLISDALTKTGVPFLYPYKARFRLLPKKYAVITSSFSEYVTLAIIILLLFMFVRLNPDIFADLITFKPL